MTTRFIQLDQPPIYAPLLEGSAFHPAWMNWFTSVHQAHTQHFKLFNDVKSTTNPNEVPTSKVLGTGVSLSEQERDNVDQVSDGVFIYNTTSKKFNFREDGVWKEIT